MLMSDLNLWLQSLGLEKYGKVLASHDIDLTVAPDLTEQDLEKLGYRSVTAANSLLLRQSCGVRLLRRQLHRRRATRPFNPCLR